MKNKKAIAPFAIVIIVFVAVVLFFLSYQWGYKDVPGLEYQLSKSQNETKAMEEDRNEWKSLAEDRKDKIKELNKSLEEEKTLNRLKDKKIENLTGEIDNKENEFLTLKERKTFNLILKGNDVYIEQFGYEIKQEIIIIFNIIFSVSIYLGLFFKFNFLNIETKLNLYFNRKRYDGFEKLIHFIKSAIILIGGFIIFAIVIITLGIILSL